MIRFENEMTSSSTGLDENLFAELKSHTCRINRSDTKWKIPFSSNSIELNGDPSTIFDTGVHNWTGSERIRLYFHVNESCELKFALKCKVPDGHSQVKIKVLGVPQESMLSGSEYHVVPVGIWKISGPGVVIMDMEGVEKTDDYFADVTHLIVAQELMNKDTISFLDDSDENFLYWNRVRPFQKFDHEFRLGDTKLAEVPDAEFVNAKAEIEEDSAWEIPFSTNSVMLNRDTSSILFDTGIHNWTSKTKSVRMFFYVNESVEVNLALKCKVPHGSSKVEVTVLELSKLFELSGSSYHNVSIGKWKISGSGCVNIDIKGIEKTDAYYADVTHLVVSSEGQMDEDTLTFLTDTHDNVLYWMKMTAFRTPKTLTDVNSEFSGWKIPFSSNSIKISGGSPVGFDKNIHKWQANEIIRMYFYVNEPCELNIALKHKVAQGSSIIRIELLDESREITLSGSAYHTTSIGKWNIPKAGCVTLEFNGIEKVSDYFAELIYLMVGRDTMQDDILSFLDDSDESIRYWQSRIPPNCHEDVLEINNLTENINAKFIKDNLDVDEYSAFWSIPFSSNSFDLAGNSSVLSDAGIHNWTPDAHIRMHFFVRRACNLNIALRCKVPRGYSKIRVRILGVAEEYQLSSSEYNYCPLGQWQVSGAGCVTVDLEGIEKTHCCFADVTHLIVYKENLETDAISFLEETDQNILYWKRMGTHRDDVGDVYNSRDVFGKDSVVYEIPFSSNSLVVNGDPSTVCSTGIHNWNGSEEIRMYFYVNDSCELNLGLKYKVPEGISEIEIGVLGNRRRFSLRGSEYHISRIGKWSAQIPGWVTVDIKGVEKTGDYYADVTHLIVSPSEIAKDSIYFLGDSSDEFFYWQSRGPPRIIRDQDIMIENTYTTNSVRAEFIRPSRDFNNSSAVWKIPFSCNSTQLDEDQSVVTKAGIRNWTSVKTYRIFFYVKDVCELELALNCKVPTGESKIIVKVLGVPKVFLLSGSEYKHVPLGKWKITDAGCVTVDLQGFLKTGGYFADVKHLLVLKENLGPDAICFLDQSDEHFLYWQKIGPPQVDATDATNEITYEAIKIWEIPCSSNSVELSGNGSTIFDTGIHDWSENEEIRIYFQVKDPCKLNLALKCKVPDGNSEIRVNVTGTSRTFWLSGSEYRQVPIGTWDIDNTAVTVDLKGLKRTGDYYADVTHLIVEKNDLDEDAISFLDDSDANLRYWKCRGSPLKDENSESVVDVSDDNNAEFISHNSKIDNYHTVWCIPFSSNSVELKGHYDSTIYKSGIHGWNSDEVIRTYFFVNGPCELNMTLWCAVPNGSSKVKVAVLGVPQVFTFSGTDRHIEPIGKWKISGSGCVTVDLEGIETTGNYFADVTYLMLSCDDLDVDAVSYLENTNLNILYWQRRGPPKIVLPNNDRKDSQDLRVTFLSSPTEIDMKGPKWELAFSANAWVLAEDTSIVSDAGLQEWKDQTVRLYLHVKKPCELNLALNCSVPEGTSEIEVSLMGEAQSFLLSGTDYHLAHVGKWKIEGIGYVPIDLKGLKKSGDYYADITHLVIPQHGLEADTIGSLDGVDSEEMHWRRRGPTVHLSYRVPKECEKAEYYYNEVMVPSGYDPVGSYFAVIGFANGYFGIQVNEPDVRKVLFSVWSPQKTDDADELTEENQVVLVNKDPETVATSFGAEGSGSKSFLRYAWRPDVTYKFLVRGRPDPMLPGYTLYGAWFGERASPHWRLVAEFSRPRGTRYLEDFYSFLENMDNDRGHTCRMARFGNQWIRDVDGKWYEATAADITGDSVSKEMTRKDFESGLTEDEEGFYVKHCGFFIGKCNLGERLHRKRKFRKPFEDLVTTKETELTRNLTVQLVEVDSVPEKSSFEMLKIPVYANGWLVKKPDDPEVIQRPNLGNWTSPEVECHVFFFVGRPMTVDLFIRCKVPDGESVINVDVCGVSKEVEIEGEDYHDVFIGRYKFKGRDYAKVVLKGVSKEDTYFADVTDLMVPKDEVTSPYVTCILDDEDASVARRGPRPHLLYQIPEQELQDEVYYVEVIVEHTNPAARIVAIGFDGGYIAIEYNQIVFVLTVHDEDSDFMDTDYNNNDNTVTTTKISLDDDDDALHTTKRSHNKIKKVLPLTTTDDGDDISCRFMLRTRKVRGNPGRVAYSAWFAQDWDNAPRRVCEDVVSSAKAMRGFYSSVEVLQADQGHLPARAVFSGQAVKKADGSIHEVTGAKVKTHGVGDTRMFDCDAGVLSLDGDDAEGFFLRTGGFVMGTDINGTVIVKKAGPAGSDKYLREFLSGTS